MAIKTVYNRDGSIYGELDTDKYLFNNTLIGSEPVKLDVELYPYVKVAGQYYKNDGEEWFTKSRANDSAGLMSIYSAYQDSLGGEYTNQPLSKAYVNLTTVAEGFDYSVKTDLESGGGLITLKDYLVNSKHIQGWAFTQNQKIQDKRAHQPYQTPTSQPLLPGSNGSNHYYWDIVPHKPILVTTNFTREIDATKEWKVYITNVGDSIVVYQLDEKNAFDPAKPYKSIPKSMCGTFWLAVKYTEDDENGLPSYIINNNLDVTDNGNWIRSIISDYVGNNKAFCVFTRDQSYPSIHLIMGENEKTPVQLTLTQTTKIKYIPIKLPDSFGIVLTNNTIQYSNYTAKWVDLIPYWIDKDSNTSETSSISSLFTKKSYTATTWYNNGWKPIKLTDSNNQKYIHIGNSGSYASTFMYSYVTRDIYISRTKYFDKGYNTLYPTDGFQLTIKGADYMFGDYEWTSSPAQTESSFDSKMTKAGSKYYMYASWQFGVTGYYVGSMCPFLSFIKKPQIVGTNTSGYQWSTPSRKNLVDNNSSISINEDYSNPFMVTSLAGINTAISVGLQVSNPSKTAISCGWAAIISKDEHSDSLYYIKPSVSNGLITESYNLVGNKYAARHTVFNPSLSTLSVDISCTGVSSVTKTIPPLSKVDINIDGLTAQKTSWTFSLKK